MKSAVLGSRFRMLLCMPIALAVWGCPDTSVAPDTAPPVVVVVAPGTGALVAGLVTIGILATDNAAVTRVEILIDGFSVANLTAAPWQVQWNTLDAADGLHLIQALAYDAAGNVGTSAPAAVTVANPYTFALFNSVFTPIAVSVEGQAAVILPGAIRSWVFQGRPSSVSFQGSTSGQTNTGVPVGLQITWSGPVPTGLLRADTIALVILSDHFYLRMRNTGAHPLNPLYVNYGLTSQTAANVVIPTDGVTYSIGYFRAFTNTQVRAYSTLTPSSFVFWNQGTHFTLPFTTNQSVSLLNNVLAPPPPFDPAPPVRPEGLAQLPLPAVVTTEPGLAAAVRRLRTIAASSASP